MGGKGWGSSLVCRGLEWQLWPSRWTCAWNGFSPVLALLPPGKAMLGLIWGGTDQQRLIKNFFAEVMLLTSPLSKNWFKPQISGEKDAEFAGKEA